jgi:integrase
MIVKWTLPSYLRQDQVRVFFSAITSPRDKALFLTVYLYGLRVSEAYLLQREDIDLERGTIRIWRVKNGYSGEKPLFRRLVAILRCYLRTRTDDNAALFVGRQGRLSKRWIQTLFTRYATAANLPPNRRHVHCLRHYSESRIMPSERSERWNHGGSLAALSVALGIIRGPGGRPGGGRLADSVRQVRSKARSWRAPAL